MDRFTGGRFQAIGDSMGFFIQAGGRLAGHGACTTAASADPMSLEFSGFGTATATYADTNKAQFIRDHQPDDADSNFAFDRRRSAAWLLISYFEDSLHHE